MLPDPHVWSGLVSCHSLLCLNAPATSMSWLHACCIFAHSVPNPWNTFPPLSICQNSTPPSRPSSYITSSVSYLLIFLHSVLLHQNSHPFIRVPTAPGRSLTAHFTSLPFFSARLNSSHLYSLASPQDLVWTAGSGKGGGTQGTCATLPCPVWRSTWQQAFWPTKRLSQWPKF